MQAKISAFFKPSSSSSSFSPKPADPPPIFDELSIWENKQHKQLYTSKRRPPNPQRGGSEEDSVNQSPKRPISYNNSLKLESTILGRTVTKNKKRSYAQLHLDLGQSDFLLHTCSTCGIMYVTGDEQDEKAHKGFHKDYTSGIQFKGWRNERVAHAPKVGAGRILLVLDSDPAAHRNKVMEVVKMMEMELGSEWILPKLFQMIGNNFYLVKLEACTSPDFCCIKCHRILELVYLFVLSQRVVGCLVAEPIKEAHKVLSCTVYGSSDGTTTNKTKVSTLEFGDIKFRREVIRKPLSVPEALNEHLNGSIICKKEAVPATCGVRAIWITPANRRKHIATRLLHALRKSFCMGFVLERSQLAFSELTSAGNALASNYVGREHVLVYNTFNT